MTITPDQALSAEQVIELLSLKPHPTCGFMGEAYRSHLTIPAAALPAEYGGERNAGGVLYFLITPAAPVRLHRIRSSQMYHHYLGEPLEVLLLRGNGSSEIHTLGHDLAGGMRPQLLIPGGTYHAARTSSAYALLATSVWARAEPEDVEMGDAERLIKGYPLAEQAIRAFTS